MKKNQWITNYVKLNYNALPDAELAKVAGVCIVTIFNIRKKNSWERALEFNHERHVLSGKKGGTTTHARDKRTGEKNSNWKGGVSKNLTTYYNTQKRRYPEKVRARRLVINAIKRGDIIKLPCNTCGNPNSYAHHEDYHKPLDVVWLCRKHHTELHASKISINEAMLINNNPTPILATHEPKLQATIIEAIKTKIAI